MALLKSWAMRLRSAVLVLLLVVAAGGGLPAGLAMAGEAPGSQPSASGHAWASAMQARVRILGVPVITVADGLSQEPGQVADAGKRADLIETKLQWLYLPRRICSSGETLAETFLEVGFLHGRQRACDGSQMALLTRPDDLTIVSQQRPGGAIELLARLPGRQVDLPLLSVGVDDARLYGTTPAQLAEQWRQQLQRRLRYARRLMQPAELAQRFRRIVLVEAALAGCVVLLLLLWRRCRRVTTALLARQVQPHLGRRHRLAVNATQLSGRALLVLVLILVVTMVAGAVFAIPGALPLALDLLLQPGGVALKLALLWVLAAVLRGLCRALLSQWAADAHVPLERRARRDQRYRNLRQVLGRLIDVSAILTAAIWILMDVPGIRELSGSALLASGALIGALAIVFQGLLRDFVAGLVVVFDDRYAIGDTVEINGIVGEVVDVGLLSTELRCSDQRVVVIQNSGFAQVVNHTKLRSGIDVRLPLASSLESIEAALQVIGDELETFAKDPQWLNLLLEAPQLRGVDALGDGMIIVSVLLLTRSGQQWRVKRALLRRLVARLQLERIPLVSREDMGRVS